METTGFFEASPGVKSMIRLCSFILLLFFIAYNLPVAIANAKAAIEGKAAIPCDLMFNLLLLVAIFFPKLLQKIVELKFGNVAINDKP